MWQKYGLGVITKKHTFLHIHELSDRNLVYACKTELVMCWFCSRGVALLNFAHGIAHPWLHN